MAIGSRSIFLFYFIFILFFFCCLEQCCYQYLCRPVISSLGYSRSGVVEPLLIAYLCCEHRLPPFLFLRLMFKASNVSALLPIVVVFRFLDYKPLRTWEGFVALQF